MFEKLGEMSHSHFLAAAAAGPGDAPTDPDCNLLTYGAVLKDVNRLSHLLGRFLESSSENPGRLEAGGLAEVGANPPAGASECPKRTSWTKAGDRWARMSFRGSRRDGGVTAADSAPGWSPVSRKKFLEELMASNGFSGMWSTYRTQKVDQDNGGEPGERESLSSSGTDELSAPPCVALEPVEHEWMLAVAEGDWERMESLLLLDANLLNKKDFVCGLTAAHWLAKQGKVETLIKLVRLAESRGLPLDLNAKAGGSGYTPLHLAAMQGHHTLVKLLVGAFSADVDTRDYSGRKAWQYLGSKAPGQLKQLAGAQEEEQEPQAVPAEKKRTRLLEAQEDQVDGPAKKPQLSRIPSIHRFFTPLYWWRRKAEDAD